MFKYCILFINIDKNVGTGVHIFFSKLFNLQCFSLISFIIYRSLENLINKREYLKFLTITTNLGILGSKFIRSMVYYNIKWLIT